MAATFDSGQLFSRFFRLRVEKHIKFDGIFPKVSTTPMNNQFSVKFSEK